MKRRQFINSVPKVSLLSLLDWHSCFQLAESSPSYPANNNPIIQQVILKTTCTLEALSHFYYQQLQLPIIEENDHQITFQTGQSLLTFERIASDEEPPFYHFAFNIPENKILAARDWQLERSPLIPSPKHMVDDGYPADIRHFRNWNAHSVFFWDPAGNLVEYIARHDLNNANKNKFSSKDILYLSEIAFIVNDVDKEANFLANQLNIKQYRNGSSNFKAMGDEMGLLLLMKKGRVWERQTKEAKSPSIHPTEVKLFKRIAPIKMNEYPYQLS